MNQADDKEEELNRNETITYQSTSDKRNKYRYRNWMTVLSSKAKDTQKNYKRFIMAFIEKYKHRGF